MKRLIIGLTLVACLLAPAACAPAGAPPPSEGMPREEAPPSPEEERPPPAPEAPAVSEEELGQPWATERMIVRTGDVSLIVEDVPEAMNQITGLAASFGGYVVSSKRWREEERLAGAIAIRVPAEHFDDAMKALRELAVDVSSEKTSSKDVTEEYVDLGSRLRNLEATEAQLLKLMEKAEKAEDILAIYRELSKTTGEIEQTKGRMQYLERTSATSLIEIRLEQARLDVQFTAHKARPKEGEEVHFASQRAGGFAPYSYQWDFGDGNTSTAEFPTHSYKAAGSYTVSLQVTDDRGNTHTETRTDYITVLPGWQVGTVATGARSALVGFGHVMVTVAIWLGIFSPLWLVIGGILYWRYRRRRKKA